MLVLLGVIIGGLITIIPGFIAPYFQRRLEKEKLYDKSLIDLSRLVLQSTNK